MARVVVVVVAEARAWPSCASRPKLRLRTRFSSPGRPGMEASACPASRESPQVGTGGFQDHTGGCPGGRGGTGGAGGAGGGGAGGVSGGILYKGTVPTVDTATTSKFTQGQAGTKGLRWRTGNERRHRWAERDSGVEPVATTGVRWFGTTRDSRIDTVGNKGSPLFCWAAAFAIATLACSRCSSSFEAGNSSTPRRRRARRCGRTHREKTIAPLTANRRARDRARSRGVAERFHVAHLRVVHGAWLSVGQDCRAYARTGARSDHAQQSQLRRVPLVVRSGPRAWASPKIAGQAHGARRRASRWECGMHRPPLAVRTRRQRMGVRSAHSMSEAHAAPREPPWPRKGATSRRSPSRKEAR